jgi:hypothetical protein
MCDRPFFRNGGSVEMKALKAMHLLLTTDRDCATRGNFTQKASVLHPPHNPA